MPATLRFLIRVSALGPRPIAQIDEAQLDRAISWVHSSDLDDPTPWLESGHLLLTDGTQFTAATAPDAVERYVTRLAALDVAGLGFATDIVHESVPRDVVDACARVGLPIVEVTGRTPFIGIIRFVADVIAADRAARFAWSLEAQRAVARAAVRDDGLRDILRTLSQRLSTWVALYDASGRRVSIPGFDPVPAAITARLDNEARMLLDRGAPVSLRSEPPNGATLQTIGQTKRLRGVLAVGAEEPLDFAEKDLVDSVIALASIALEQQRQLDASRRRIRTGVVKLLLAGQIREARRTARAVWGALPEPPFLVGAVSGPLPGQSGPHELEILAAAQSGSIFFAERGDNVCPSSARAIEEIMHEAGVPVGGYTNLYATHDQIAGVIADPRVQGVSLTGSERAGSIIGAQAGRHLKKAVLELGGIDPMVVLSSDDVARVAGDAWDFRVYNAGQVCNSNKRMIVMDDIYDAFVAELVARAEGLVPGDPLNLAEGAFVPLSSRAAAETVDAQVQRAVAEGATLLAGGVLADDGTAYFSPAVLTGVTRDSSIYGEEIFGPVAIVLSVSSDEEALEVANDSDFGLGGSVFATDEARALVVASRLDVGMTHVNIIAAEAAELPFGGVKRSGFGREMGPLGMDEIVNKRFSFVAR